MKTGWFVLTIVILALIVGASVRYYVENRYLPARTAVATPSPTPAPVVMVLENGVVYFELTNDDYLKALQTFYQENPTLHCDYQGATEKLVEQGPWVDAKAYSVITGHILHCHDIAIEAQEITKE